MTPGLGFPGVWHWQLSVMQRFPGGGSPNFVKSRFENVVFNSEESSVLCSACIDVSIVTTVMFADFFLLLLLPLKPDEHFSLLASESM